MKNDKISKFEDWDKLLEKYCFYIQARGHDRKRDKKPDIAEFA